MSWDDSRNGGFDRTATTRDDVSAARDLRERYVLYCLSEHGVLALSDLADEVTVWETGRRLPEVPATEERTVYLALYHTHVPRLERAGLVVYGQELDLVALSSTGRERAYPKPLQPAPGANAPTIPDEGDWTPEERGPASDEPRSMHEDQ